MALFPVDPYGFSGQLGGMAGPDGLSARLNDLHYRLVTLEGDIEEADRVDLWIDGTSGSDSNGGTSLVDAVQTVPKLKELISEFIKSRFVIINMRGNIQLTGGSQDSSISHDLSNSLQFNTVPGTEAAAGGKTDPIIIIDGGTAVTTVKASAVSNNNAAGQIGETGVYSVNQYKGEWCRITSGPLAGQTFAIKYNDVNTLYLLTAGDPGAGATYVIERPATTISAGPFWMGQAQSFGVFLNGSGSVFIQNLFFYNGVTPILGSADAAVANSDIYMGRCVIDAFGPGGFNSNFFGFLIGASCSVVIDGHFWDVGVSPAIPTFTSGGSGASNGHIGVTFNGDPLGGALFLYCDRPCEVFWSVLPVTAAWYCDGAFRIGESYAQQLTFLNSLLTGHGGGKTIENFSVPVEVGGNVAVGAQSKPAIEVSGSALDMQSPILDYSTYGMRMIHSKVVMSGVSGSNNTLGGVWADAHSTVLQPPGHAVNTVVGNAVELSLNGAAQVRAWAALKHIAATGSITAVAVASLIDGETFVLDDGVNPAVTFEFDNNASVVETATLRQVDISAITTAAEVATAIYNAINTAPTLDILATDPAGGTVVALENIGNVGATGNVAITETVTDVGFLVSGMSGGQTPAPVSDPELVAKEGSDIYTGSW